jgi:uncharacterized protein (TIGR02246 family)
MQWTLLGASAPALVLLMAGCQQAPPPEPKVDVAAEVAKVMETDAAWLKAVQAKDAAGAASYYAEDGRIMPQGMPIAQGREAIQQVWSEMFKMPDVSLSWENSETQVSSGGDLAYNIGKYDMSFKDPKGKPVVDKGKFVVVWKKQADGNWKVVADIFNSDQPPAPAKK